MKKQLLFSVLNNGDLFSIIVGNTVYRKTGKLTYELDSSSDVTPYSWLVSSVKPFGEIMFDPSKYTCLRQGVTNVYVDQKLALGTIKVNCPTFWKNKLPGEKKTMYRGHLIIEYNQEFRSSGIEKVVSIHVYDCRFNVIRSFGTPSNTKSLDDAKAIIDDRFDDRIDNPDEPFTYSEEEVEVEIIVKVTVGCFRDNEGFLSNGSVVSWDQIGPKTGWTVNQNDPGSCLMTIIGNQAIDNLR